MTTSYLNKVHDVGGAGETVQLYEEWAGSYDADLDENGYATPARCAEALRAKVADLSTPVLDYGCGTGLSGVALRDAGFTVIDGMDPSDAMLASAREKGCYRELVTISTEDSSPVPQGLYGAIAAIGVIGAGAAPLAVFDILMKALPEGGRLVFSFNDRTLEDPAYEARVAEWLDGGAARLLFKEYGPHLPGFDMKANVYVLEKV